MKQKGSMTIAMSLMLLAFLPLIAVTIRASQTACARVQSVNGIDTALYSLFSEYDKELLETYNLFFLDAGYGTGKLDIGQMISQAEHYAKPVLSSGMTRCSIQACGAEGFRLASDRKGKAVEQQIIRYMKGNLGAAGIEKLKDKLEENRTILQQQEEIQAQGMEETVPENAAPMEGISAENNPLEIIKSLKNNGFLGLVLPADTQVSEKVQPLGEVLSHRTIETGQGDFAQMDVKSSVTDKLLIQEYVLEKLGTFTEPGKEGALDYQAEYVLGGKASDKENLSYVVNRLLLIREPANLAFLYTDAQKRAELEACAAALSFLLLIPEGMELVQGVLAAGWAYVESLSDVRILLSGGKVPLIKDSTAWKTQLENLNQNTSITGGRGQDYEEYLRILFTFAPKDKSLMRTMDMIEQNICKTEGRENFRFDVCVDAVSLSFLIKGPNNMTWQADRFYTYDM